MANTATTYDEFPYSGLAYWFSHPDHLGVMAGLRGIRTALAEDCQVLEIGCGDGGNLLSLASLYPGSRFTGLDLSRVQIDLGVEVARQVGLENVALHHADLTDFVVEPGTYDFVIAHGVYSWVPAAVRDALLTLAARALAPTGVALVSYNPPPGRAALEPVRQLMRFHTASLFEPGAKIQNARSIGARWCDHFEASDPEGRGPLAQEIASMLAAASDDIIRHDWISEAESPVWFSDFVEHARRHGLAYLDNGLASAQRPELLEPEARELFARLQDPLRAQQYVDFFNGTRFRVTLLVRADAPRSAPLTLADLALESRLAGPTAGGVEGLSPAGRIALDLVAERAPAAISLCLVRDAVLEQLQRDHLAANIAATDAARATLLSHLEAVFTILWRHDLVHLWRHPPALARGEYPVTGMLQRFLAARGAPVPNLCHRHTDLSPAERELLAALDGTKDLRALTTRFGPETERTLASLWMKRLLGDRPL